MSTAFARTMRALHADSFRGTLLAFVLIAVLLAAWVAWFFLASVSRYEVTGTARLEVDQAMHAVQSPMLGRVISSRLVLDRRVRAGDVLLELDANPQRLEARESGTRLNALATQIASIRNEIAAAEEARAREQQAAAIALQEAVAHSREADALARLSASEAGRLEQLHAQGLVPQRDFERGKLEAERRRAAAEALQLVPGRLEREQRTREGDREVHVKQLWADIERLEGERKAAGAAIARLQYEIEQRVIRAPVSGRLGEVATLRPGAVVDEGEKLAAVVPEGIVHAVAEFPPAAALGRIHPGQRARLRLESFSWTQYGSVPATVSSVGSEIRNGTVRVELRLKENPASLVPIQHGLPGSAEVEVERLSPAGLVLRAAGRLIAAPRSPFERR